MRLRLLHSAVYHICRIAVVAQSGCNWLASACRTDPGSGREEHFGPGGGVSASVPCSAAENGFVFVCILAPGQGAGQSEAVGVCETALMVPHSAELGVWVQVTASQTGRPWPGVIPGRSCSAVYRVVNWALRLQVGSSDRLLSWFTPAHIQLWKLLQC